MSNIYVQEPPSNGKVVLTTTLGEIEIELWSKECPKACRNFVQLCLENFYDSTIFHRVVPNFIAQGGDPSGTGLGGESIYGEPFKNEVHSRLRFVRRGLVATANTGNNDNESQFFFTLGTTPELQNKHTIFGKVGGNTLFNMIKFNDLDCDREDRPYHPPKIIRTEVINNPFPDIVPRIDEKKTEKKDDKKKIKGTKNLKLLSFGAEEEEDEEESTFSKTQTFKGKSSHDLTDDPTLSVVPAVEQSDDSDDNSPSSSAPVSSEANSAQLERIQSKLKQGSALTKKATSKADQQEKEQDHQDDQEIDSDEERKETEQQKLNSIKQEIRSLKRQLQGKDGDKDDAKKTKPSEDEEPVNEEEEKNDVLKDFHLQQQKYAQQKRVVSKKKNEVSKREQDTLALLKKFQQKLEGAKSKQLPADSEERSEDAPEDTNNESWYDFRFIRTSP